MRNTLDNRSFPMALILVDILVLTIEDIKEWEVNLDKDMEVSPICLPIFLDLRFKTSCTTCTTRPFVFPSVRKNVSSFSSFSFTLSNTPVTSCYILPVIPPFHPVTHPLHPVKPHSHHVTTPKTPSPLQLVIPPFTPILHPVTPVSPSLHPFTLLYAPLHPCYALLNPVLHAVSPPLV